MAYIIQNSPAVVQRAANDPVQVNRVGIFGHIVATDKLYITERFEGHIAETEIANVAFGSSLTPPSGIRQSLYHPNGTNELFVKEANGTWVNIAGLQPGGSTAVTFFVNSVTGNDTTGDGSAQAPFKTFLFAYNQLPHDPPGPCIIRLIDVGPYDLPANLNAVCPQGTAGQPVMICGDMTLPADYTGTVLSVSQGRVTVAGSPFSSVQGYLYHGLTGASAGQYYQIASHTNNTLTSIGNSFGASPGDTFEILRWCTVLNCPGDFVINGPGKIGFWHCQIQYTNMRVVGTDVLFDACKLVGQNAFFGELQATCQFLPAHASKDFSQIYRNSSVTIGTMAGKVGAHFKASVPTTPGVVRMADGSYGSGYVICDTGLETETAGRWQIFGIYTDLANSNSIVGINSKSYGYLELNNGLQVIKGRGPSCIGIQVQQGSTAQFTSSPVTITGCDVAGILVEDGSVLNMDSAGGPTSCGLGPGVLVRNGGTLFNRGGNTVFGTAGAVQVEPNAVPLDWQFIPFMIVSYPFGLNTRSRSVTDSNYQCLVTDQAVTYSAALTAPRTVTLPNPALTGASADYIKRIVVQSMTATTGTHAITLVNPTGVVNGNGVLSTAYGNVTVYTQGTSWFVQSRR